MSHVVETIVEADFFKIPVKSNNNAQAQEQEVKDCTEFLRIEYQKYRQHKSLLEGIEECMQDENNLDDDLRKKIKSVILGTSVSQTKLSSNINEDSLETVLGVAVGNTVITYSERDKLLSCLKSHFENKSGKLKTVCVSLFGHQDISKTGIEKSESPLDLTHDDTVLLEFRSKLAFEQECFLRNQIELLELLEQLKTLRLKTVPEVTEQKIQDCSLRSRINFLKSQLAKNKCKIDIFMESSKSLKAYTEIIKDMKEQRDALTVEIEQLKDLKKKYAQVSCKEYDDILQSYLQYKASFEKRKMMFELYE